MADCLRQPLNRPELFRRGRYIPILRAVDGLTPPDGATVSLARVQPPNELPLPGRRFSMRRLRGRCRLTFGLLELLSQSVDQAGLFHENSADND